MKFIKTVELKFKRGVITTDLYRGDLARSKYMPHQGKKECARRVG